MIEDHLGLSGQEKEKDRDPDALPEEGEALLIPTRTCHHPDLQVNEDGICCDCGAKIEGKEGSPKMTQEPYDRIASEGLKPGCEDNP